MKYGANFENESVPEWSLHNIDYNSLKHHIKAHTFKGQASAIAIPGHQDELLKRFEDDFYAELCRQHDRVGLFVTSKASELSRRLQHFSDCIHDTLRRSAGRRLSPKRQRRMAKFELAVVQCGDEIHDLSRFVNAQVVAFRKILKKYKKWTGSPHLTVRFKENVLSDPKSFTNRDFHTLERQSEDLLSEVRAPGTPADSGPATPVSRPGTPARRRSIQHTSPPLIVVHEDSEGYWNEYDHGSESGDPEGGYAIYIDPDNDSHFGGAISSFFATVFSMPVTTAKAWWLSSGRGGLATSETRPLLGQSTPAGSVGGPEASRGPYGAFAEGASTSDGPPSLECCDGHRPNNKQYNHSHPIDSTPSAAGGYNAGAEVGFDDYDDYDDGGEAGSLGYASEEDFPRGYETRYAALPSINEQRVTIYREKVLFWGTIGADATSLVLLGIAALLLSTGRHRLRVEVDAGVTVGSLASLCCACAALGMTLARRTRLGWSNRLAVYGTFVAICMLNGVLLVLVVGNTALPAVGTITQIRLRRWAGEWFS